MEHTNYSADYGIPGSRTLIGETRALYHLDDRLGSAHSRNRLRRPRRSRIHGGDSLFGFGMVGGMDSNVYSFFEDVSIAGVQQMQVQTQQLTDLIDGMTGER